MDEDRSVLHYLTRIGVMDDGHISGGMTYLDWQHSYGKASGARTSRYGDQSAGAEVEEKAAKYASLINRIGTHTQRRVEQGLMIRPVHQTIKCTLYERRYEYIDAFNRLGELIIEVNKLFPCAPRSTDIAS